MSPMLRMLSACRGVVRHRHIPSCRTEAVVRASADGYTLLLASPLSAINATLYEKLNFNFLRDIAPVAGVVRAPFVMVVNPSVPAKPFPSS